MGYSTVFFRRLASTRGRRRTSLFFQPIRSSTHRFKRTNISSYEKLLTNRVFEMDRNISENNSNDSTKKIIHLMTMRDTLLDVSLFRETGRMKRHKKITSFDRANEIRKHNTSADGMWYKKLCKPVLVGWRRDRAGTDWRRSILNSQFTHAVLPNLKIKSFPTAYFENVVRHKSNSCNCFSDDTYYKTLFSNGIYDRVYCEQRVVVRRVW